MLKDIKGLKFIILFIVFYFSSISFPQVNIKLRFIGSNNDFPYEFINEQGKPDGFSIELIKAIGKVINADISIKLESSKDLNNEILYGNDFDISELFYSENRDQYVSFSSPVLFSEAEIYINKETEHINAITDLMDKRVAVKEGSFVQEYMERNLPGVNLLLTESIPAALEALSQGKCDAAIVERNVSERSIPHLGITNLKTTAYPVIPREFGFVVPKKDSVLLSNINLGLAVLKNNGTYTALFNKWITQTAPTKIGIHTIVQWGGIFLAVIILITAIIFFWIKSLRRLVHLRTLDLQKEIAEHIKTEEELKIQKEKAEESNRLKSEFLAQMSHEIRTPLNVILGYISLLEIELKDYLTEDLVDIFVSIKEASYRLMRTVTSILDMSALRTRKYEADFEILNINEILNNLFDNFQNFARNKNLIFEFDEKLQNTLIKADYYTTVKLFENLIDNAVKFTKSGSIKIIIGNTNNDKINVAIKDTGIGIAKDYMQKIFEPFTQESTGNSRRFEGNGLGLSLVKEYADINNFKIIIESEKGSGTVVSVLIHPVSRN